MAQKAHDVGTLEGAPAVEDKGAVKASQVFGFVEEQVGGVFGLGGTPVVGKVGKGLENFLLQRMRWGQQAVEQWQRPTTGCS